MPGTARWKVHAGETPAVSVRLREVPCIKPFPRLAKSVPHTGMTTPEHDWPRQARLSVARLDGARAGGHRATGRRPHRSTGIARLQHQEPVPFPASPVRRRGRPHRSTGFAGVPRAAASPASASRQAEGRWSAQAGRSPPPPSPPVQGRGAPAGPTSRLRPRRRADTLVLPADAAQDGVQAATGREAGRCRPVGLTSGFRLSTCRASSTASRDRLYRPRRAPASGRLRRPVPR